jgi:polyisoprenoid-binding protein YceI
MTALTGGVMTLVKNDVTPFSIDSKASLFTVQAFASGIVAVVAHSPKFAIRDFSGAAMFSPDSIEDSSLDLSIKIRSLEIMDEVRTSDRQEIERVMFDEVLEASRYPSVQFKSSRVTATKTGDSMYSMAVLGDLNLHGMTRGMKLESQGMVGEETRKAQGSFSVRQTDFDLKIASVAGGSRKLKDQLKCGYFIIARRRRSRPTRKSADS